MLIEAIQPLTILLPNGRLRLEPGHPVDFPEDRARRLLEKAPGKVRVVAPRPEIQALNAQAREALNDFFCQEINPRLVALFKAGKLPRDWALREDWLRVEAAWNQCADPSPVPCDVERVKGLLGAYVERQEAQRKRGV